MDNKEIRWEIQEIAPGIVKIGANAFGKIPTFEEFIRKAREILFQKDNLCNETMNADLAEAFLLRQELKNEETNKVVFTCGDNTYMADKNNINNLKEAFEKMPNIFVDSQKTKGLELGTR